MRTRRKRPAHAGSVFPKLAAFEPWPLHFGDRIGLWRLRPRIESRPHLLEGGQGRSGPFVPAHIHHKHCSPHRIPELLFPGLCFWGWVPSVSLFGSWTFPEKNLDFLQDSDCFPFFRAPEKETNRGLLWDAPTTSQTTLRGPRRATAPAPPGTAAGPAGARRLTKAPRGFTPPLMGVEVEILATRVSVFREVPLNRKRAGREMPGCTWE